jgi:hypothetical protein
VLIAQMNAKGVNVIKRISKEPKAKIPKNDLTFIFINFIIEALKRLSIKKLGTNVP